MTKICMRPFVLGQRLYEALKCQYAPRIQSKADAGPHPDDALL